MYGNYLSLTVNDMDCKEYIFVKPLLLAQIKDLCTDYYFDPYSDDTLFIYKPAHDDCPSYLDGKSFYGKLSHDGKYINGLLVRAYSQKNRRLFLREFLKRINSDFIENDDASYQFYLLRKRDLIKKCNELRKNITTKE